MQTSACVYILTYFLLCLAYNNVNDISTNDNDKGMTIMCKTTKPKNQNQNTINK